MRYSPLLTAMLATTLGCRRRSYSTSLTLIVWPLLLANPCPGAASSVVGGLYKHYYNAGFDSTPITSTPVWSNLTAANVTFHPNISGQVDNPQESSSDAYCGGYFRGQLLISTAGTYALQVLASQGFTLAVNNYTILNNTGVHLFLVDTSAEFVTCAPHSPSQQPITPCKVSTSG